MKIKPYVSPSVGDPIGHITFHRTDRTRIDAIAAVLAQLDDDVVEVVRSALARYSVHLDELRSWTEGAIEADRARRYLYTVTAYQAAREARVHHQLDLARAAANALNRANGTGPTHTT